MIVDWMMLQGQLEVEIPRVTSLQRHPVIRFKCLEDCRWDLRWECHKDQRFPSPLRESWEAMNGMRQDLLQSVKYLSDNQCKKSVCGSCLRRHTERDWNLQGYYGTPSQLPQQLSQHLAQPVYNTPIESRSRPGIQLVPRNSMPGYQTRTRSISNPNPPPSPRPVNRQDYARNYTQNHYSHGAI